MILEKVIKQGRKVLKYLEEKQRKREISERFGSLLEDKRYFHRLAVMYYLDDEKEEDIIEDSIRYFKERRGQEKTLEDIKNYLHTLVDSIRNYGTTNTFDALQIKLMVAKHDITPEERKKNSIIELERHGYKLAD